MVSRALGIFVLSAVFFAQPAYGNSPRRLVAFLDRVQVGLSAAKGIATFGCGTFDVDTAANTVDFRIVFTPLPSGELIAHIHGAASPGNSAPPIFTLPAGNPKVGTWNYDQADEADILNGLMYVNIHSNDFPAGEIRGQMVDLVASVDGAQVPSPSASQGFGTFLIDTQANTLDFHIAYDPLSSGETVAHIHGPALHTLDAVPVFTLPAANPKVGTWNFSDADEANLLNGLMYVNMHSNDFPAGEIRGQITPIVVPIDESQVNPATGSPAAGCGLISIDKEVDDLGFDIRFDGLVAPELVAHIHGFAPAGMSALPLFTLPPGSPKLGIWDFDDSQQADIQADLTYINMHSDDFPAGEIRGQIEFPSKLKCVCNDGDVCTKDECIDGLCVFTPGKTYGDMDNDDDVDLFDLFCILNCFSNDFSACSFDKCDLEPCEGDVDVDLFDLFAVLNAFSGDDPCCGG